MLLIITLIFILVGLVVTELTIQRSFHRVHEVGFIKPNVPCQPGKISCESNVDCIRCSDKLKLSLTCRQVSNNVSDKKCLPRKPLQLCNAKLGGVWVWSGTEWFCSCAYPGIAAGKGCQKVNPNVCQGGKFTFNATKGKPYSIHDCQCKKGAYRFVDSQSVPVCVTPQKNSPCHSKGSCARLYSLHSNA